MDSAVSPPARTAGRARPLTVTVAASCLTIAAVLVLAGITTETWQYFVSLDISSELIAEGVLRAESMFETVTMLRVIAEHVVVLAACVTLAGSAVLMRRRVRRARTIAWAVGSPLLRTVCPTWWPTDPGSACPG